MAPTALEISATLLFACALIQGFNASRFSRLKNRFLHLFSEVEFVFLFWGLLLLILRPLYSSIPETWAWIHRVGVTEPFFVFTIMMVSGSKPILNLATRVLQKLGRSRASLSFALLVAGPLLGSILTEPAAMVVCALLLDRALLGEGPSRKLLYSSFATLLVNISIGGILTSFAAPPVLMVARTWGWDTPLMLRTYGWATLFGVTLNSLLFWALNRRELAAPLTDAPPPPDSDSLLSVIGHLLFLGATLFASHEPFILFGLAFGFWFFTRPFIRGPLLVGGFLFGLTLLTSDQAWWLTPFLSDTNAGRLFIGTSLLTSITDNAAITALAATVPNLDSGLRAIIVGGAVAGGGLTLLANAPNPAGFSILRDRFQGSFSPLLFFMYALFPTMIAGGLLWIATS